MTASRSRPGAGRASAGHPCDPAWAARILATPPGVGGVRLVCVDGPAGAGKTTLAAALAAEVSALLAGADVPVVHADDLDEGWAVVASADNRVEAFGLLAERVRTWLLEPWSEDRPGAHPVWDWGRDAWGEPVEVAPAEVVVLEGVGLGGRTLRSRAAVTVWIETDPDLALDRVLARDGEALREAMVDWRRDEALWHALDQTRAGADVRVRT